MTTNRNDSVNNPLLTQNGFPPFDKINASHVIPAIRHLLEISEKKIAALEENYQPTWDGLLKPLEEMELAFEYGWGPVSHLMGVKNSEELRKAHEAVLAEIVQFSLRVKQSPAVYKGLQQIRKSDVWNTLDEAQQRIISQKLRQAQHAGVGLVGQDKERFNAIASELSKLSNDFSNHILDSSKAFELIIENPEETKGWPQSLRQIASHSYKQRKGENAGESTPQAGPWCITLDYPCYIPFMEHHCNRQQREQVYRAFITRAAEGEWDNAPLIKNILKLRKEQVALLGYENYAELSLASKMAPDVSAVKIMVQQLQDASKQPAQDDLREIQELAQKSGEEEPLAHWDTAFWAERLRELRFTYTDDDLRPYFPLSRVLDGLFDLCTRLFGITFEKAEGQAPVWHSDVQFFEVLNENEETIAWFYLDPYSRPAEKRGGAWMDNCLSRCIVDGELRLPVVHLCCNGTPPTSDQPSLMSFNEVETLFHEFGHGLQAMLTTVNYADAAGVNGIEWDAVEIASQFMENWCYHKPTLTGMTAHIETGKPLPAALFEKICAARTFRAGSFMMRQLEFGLTDIALHTSFDPEGEKSVFDVHREIARETSALPPLQENRFLCAFSHIFAGGYAAGYYSYKWSEVLSADAFSAFEEAGLDDEQAIANLGRKYRDTILACGGGRDPMAVFKDFRGREPKVDALLRHYGLAK
ncbi:MAG: M3 family metallopeptidase [Deferribacteres bacterium]|nr:M3 family metallopeptidase [candidate division KSB1 bacterium]MCB9500619.1 M3 family metallopeptidase [Deferribacteres bacterium]